jgi:hypothetical protein
MRNPESGLAALPRFRKIPAFRQTTPLLPFIFNAIVWG